MPGALFQDRCKWASTIPGINVAPLPSMTVALPCIGLAPTRDEPRDTCLMRLPWMRTSPV